MGYTHYWRRPGIIERQTFARIVEDFKKLLPELERYGVRLGNGMGENKPTITNECVEFNGLKNCGHAKNEAVVIPWPSRTAGGVARLGEDVTAGSWFAGTLLEKRTCDGECWYEPFSFPMDCTGEEWRTADKEGLYFDCCKTAFRPYDLAVTCFLLIAKRYLGASLLVSTDGEDAHWFDAKLLCNLVLGYGLEFAVRKGRLERVEGTQQKRSNQK